MSKIRLVINGFGRIGRMVFRASLKKAIKGETRIDPELIRVSKIMNI